MVKTYGIGQKLLEKVSLANALCYPIVPQSPDLILILKIPKSS